MIQKFKLTTLMIALVAVMGLSLQSCCDDCDEPCEEPQVKVYTAPSFKATNISVNGDKSLTASDNKAVVNLNYSVTITINGEPQIFTGACSSNELPVIVGNEVEIEASFDDDAATSNICFTMPDGSKEIVSKNNPICKWIVPNSFNAGDKIVAQWADNSGKIQHESLSSSITLISL